MWRARIYCLGKHVTLGRYSTAQEAAFAHDRAAYFIHGERANINYGHEVARKSNLRAPPSVSWRVMNTLELLARDYTRRQAMLEAGSVALTRAPLVTPCFMRRSGTAPPSPIVTPAGLQQKNDACTTARIRRNRLISALVEIACRM
jgi:hypothetical protein